MCVRQQHSLLASVRRSCVPPQCAATWIQVFLVRGAAMDIGKGTERTMYVFSYKSMGTLVPYGMHLSTHARTPARHCIRMRETPQEHTRTLACISLSSLVCLCGSCVHCSGMVRPTNSADARRAMASARDRITCAHTHRSHTHTYHMSTHGTSTLTIDLGHSSPP